MTQDKKAADGEGEAPDPLPPDVRAIVEDPARLAVLHGLNTLRQPHDIDFDQLAKLTARLFDAPVAMVSLIDGERQWYKACVGVDATGTGVEDAFCAHTLAVPQGEILVVADLSLDARFSSNPFVANPPHVRFYAGAPMTVRGARIGTVCIIDLKPRPPLSESQIADLTGLAALASSLFAFKDGARRADISDAALIRAEKRHELALSAGSIASWVWDLQSDVVECDPLLQDLFNLPRAVHTKASELFDAIDGRDLATARARMDDAIRNGTDYVAEFRVKDVDPPRWLAGRGRVFERDADGTPILVFGVNFDISEGKLGHDRQRLLLRELNHRVKNTLATVQALATQTVRHSKEPRDFLEAFNGRLQALGLAHNLLSDHEWRGISLLELIEMQVLPLVDNDGERIVVAGPKVHLSPDQAVALGMILHELATNAVKYGSLSVAQGHVHLDWEVGRTDNVRLMKLRWIETGGPPVSAPTRKGFGSILIERSLGKVLSSRITHEYLADGVRADMSMQLDEAENRDDDARR